MTVITNEESRSVHCSTCGAKPGEFCKTSSGNVAVFAHSNRWYRFRMQAPPDEEPVASEESAAFVEILKAFPTRTIGEIEKLLRAANRFMNGSRFFNREGDK